MEIDDGFDDVVVDCVGDFGFKVICDFVDDGLGVVFGEMYDEDVVVYCEVVLGGVEVYCFGDF